MRFLADEMAVRLARLLRAAGYDVYLAAGGQSDDELLAIAEADNRILLTRDKRLAARAHPRSVLIEGRGSREEAVGLSAKLPIDWRLAPFTRCVVDNSPLRAAAAAELAALPPEAKALGGPYRACPACRRLYWPGSHVKRMSETLDHLAQMPPQALL